MKDNISKIRQSAEHIFDSIMGFVYPPQCVICDKLHEGERFFLCDRCAHALDFYTAPHCFKCKNMIDSGGRKCSRCSGSDRISKIWACSAYDDFIRPLIHSFKYAGVIPAGKYLAVKLGQLMADGLDAHDVDTIVPVPLHPMRERKRGFNQSIFISEWLQEELNISVYADALIRIRRTRDQTGLNRQKRRENMLGAFRANSKIDLEDKSVILVDDVTTSGATASEAAKVLKNAGVSEIQLAVLAIAGHDLQE
ncbi:MAG TPA: ComF family protein [candidate division Zixibacteria bacterium]|nr:ComF family protein [candidate division Zixibacteria bacterium]HER00544.1 ComF family protein [candidate division Zixibacteria bacterium]